MPTSAVPTRVMVTTAGRPPTPDKARYVVEIARRMGAELCVLHIHAAGEPSAAGAAFTSFRNAARDTTVRVRCVVKEGPVVPTILKAANEEQPAFVIMGASEGKVVGEWVSADVIGKGNVPVLVIPSQLE